ncbi:hypothetical protein SAMN04487928_110117 [Butyrivibrio proteoclasticus]|uniref:Uncharacterized protein n=1 Tax=Butyrivibrio proteoclasticus TaxID=43305 RepID=A0A1I5U0W7_9FIRM|nr:hypothetical protein [Butyrivibrio proteoclasticus]SFP88216.1 hypothetical protein SAMN04487928_110117 [Butyrivibrio proteoclasticus]
MNISKNTQNKIYIAIIAIALIAIIGLTVGYLKERKASIDDSGETTIATMKPKEDKVVVTINTEVIQDGLTNMGILITQEY